MSAAESSDWGSEWDGVADVVVVGCGAAGASAAATAASEGASVIILEKAPFAGGTTAKSGAMMWIPNNPLLRDQGLVDDRNDALRYMARTAYPVLFDPDDDTLGLPADRYRMLEAFYDNGSAAIEHHLATGAITVEAVPYPDYYAHLPVDAGHSGRTIQPELPQGWTSGRDPMGGQMLVDDLLRYTEQHGGELRVEHEAVHLLRNEAEEVIGVEAHVGRRTVIIGARRGVIFGSGGFLHDERLALEHLRGPVFGGAAAAEATGDFVRIGMEAGAQLGNMAHAWWSQVVVELAVRRRATTGDVYSPYGDSMLMVNRFGRRAVNEKAPYNERSQAHFDWNPYRGEYPNLLLFMIFDQAVVDSPRPEGEAGMFRWPVPLDDRRRQYVIKVDSLDELADELRERLARIASHTGGVELDDDFTATLAKTIDRFNEMAARGRDDDFDRGATPIEQTWAGPARDGAPTGTMHPLSPTGPYYCVILGPGALDTKGGPITDERARVLSMAGEPIPGLYGAGNCVASPAGQAYWGPGGTIGLAVTFGYIAARDAVGQPDRSP
jgi:succinate dehydrogenase/fumarate reductase flavoprotein subunit